MKAEKFSSNYFQIQLPQKEKSSTPGAKNIMVSEFKLNEN